MRSVQGKHASYNIQSVVDDKNSLIIHTEAINDTSDINQFARQVNQANEVLNDPCEIACADAGYADTKELEKIDKQEIKVIVPSVSQTSGEAEKPFNKRQFNYDSKSDCYHCPKGHTLRYMSTNKKNGKRWYQIIDKALCFSCEHWGECTKGKSGRRIVRLPTETIREKLERQYTEKASKEIYTRRKAKVEHPFGHIKRNLKTDAFLLRGREGVQAETSILASCFNIARMITLFGGVGELVQNLREQKAIIGG